MIELRRRLERGLRHPLLGPLCLIVLALILAFTVMHGAHDQMQAAGELFACVAFLIGAIVSLSMPRLREATTIALRAPRGPPVSPVSEPLSGRTRSFASQSPSLRL